MPAEARVITFSAKYVLYEQRHDRSGHWCGVQSPSREGLWGDAGADDLNAMGLKPHRGNDGADCDATNHESRTLHATDVIPAVYNHGAQSAHKARPTVRQP